jgi:hypothetical protein
MTRARRGEGLWGRRRACAQRDVRQGGPLHRRGRVEDQRPRLAAVCAVLGENL